MRKQTVINSKKFAICMLAMAASVLSAAAQDVISTVVGGGPNGIPGVNANVNQPFMEAIDSSGNIYFAAAAQNRVFKISTSGILTVVAGNGANTYSGDGGPAVQASLNSPWGVAVDTASPAHVYIADTANCLIRKVDQTTGIITSIAGKINSPTSSSCGYSGNSGPALGAELYYPSGIAVDPTGNIYEVEFFNGVLRKISTGGTIGLKAGGGGSATAGNNCGGSSPFGDGGAATSAYLCYPQAVTLDNSVSPSNVFISQASNGGRCAVREVVGSSQDIYTVAGNNTCGFIDGVTATSGEINDPWQTHVSVSGSTTTVQIADYGNALVRQFTLTYSGGVPHPGNITSIAGKRQGGYCGDGGPVSAACMNPIGLVYDASGNYYLGDYGANRIRKVLKSDSFISTIAGWGTNGGTQPNFSDPVGLTASGGTPSLYYPAGVFADNVGGKIYIGGYNGEAVYQYTPSTAKVSGFAGSGAAGFAGDGGPADATTAEFNAPSGVARDSSGNIYIADYNNCAIREVKASTGDITTIAGGTSGALNGCGYTPDGNTAVNTRFSGITSIAFSPAGNLYVADYNNCAIRKIAAGTNIVTTVAGGSATALYGCGYSGDLGPASKAQLRNPTQISIDSQSNIYFADFNDCRVREIVHATGIIMTVAGDGSCTYTGDGVAISNAINQAQGVWSDPNGNLFIADTNNQILRWVTPTGQMTTFAGTPDSAGFVGDGGPALSAKFSSPVQIAQDSAGNIYTADYYNFRIRRVTPFAGFGLSTANLSFETQPAGTASDFQPVKVSAVGPTTISAVNVSANFTEIDDCAGTTLGAGQSCEVDVYFTPTSAGSIIGSLSFSSNAKFATQLNAVSLNGTASGLSLSGSLAFGTTVLKTPVTKTVTLTNSGASVSLTKIFMTDATDYSISGGTCPASGGTLGSHASCTITVKFSPTTIGGKKGTLVVESNDPASPLLAQATGTGTSVKLSATSLSYGTITHGTTKTLDLTVTNVGSSNLTISTAISGTNPTDFAVLTTGNTCTSAVVAGGSCTLPVEFKPAAAASYSATLTLTTNGDSNPTVSLTGTGN
jgi:hypothetical protein